jgi:hypothetical protein
MELWGDNPHIPIVQGANLVAQLEWVYDTFIVPGAPEECDTAFNNHSPLAPLRAAHTLTLQSFHACFEEVVGDAQNNGL